MGFVVVVRRRSSDDDVLFVGLIMSKTNNSGMVVKSYTGDQEAKVWKYIFILFS